MMMYQMLILMIMKRRTEVHTDLFYVFVLLFYYYFLLSLSLCGCWLMNSGTQVLLSVGDLPFHILMMWAGRMFNE